MEPLNRCRVARSCRRRYRSWTSVRMGITMAVVNSGRTCAGIQVLSILWTQNSRTPGIAFLKLEWLEEVAVPRRSNRRNSLYMEPTNVFER